MRTKKRRESRYQQIARLAYQLTQRQVAAYCHPNSRKTYTQPQLMACVLLGFYLDRSYRDLQEWLLASDRVCEALGLEAGPHYSTLCRTCHHLSLAVLKRLNCLFLKQAGVCEETIVVDATGLSATRASRHYLSQTGRTMTDYIKGYFVIGVDSQYILGGVLHAVQVSRMLPISIYLHRLRQQGCVYTCQVKGRYAYALLGDKGFDGIQARPSDLIPPRQGQHPVKREDRRLRLELTGQARLDGFLGHRWKVETVISVMKRKSGDTLRSALEVRQRREIGIKALVYNLHRFCVVGFCLLLNFATKLLQQARGSGK